MSFSQPTKQTVLKIKSSVKAIRFANPSEILAHPLKALTKSLKCFEKPLTSHLSAVSFCPFNGKVLLYVFLAKVTYCNTMYSYYENEATNDIRRCLYCSFML